MSGDYPYGGWLRRVIGLDGVDLALHGLITAGAMFFFGRVGAPEVVPIAFTVSIGVLAVRRHAALRKLRDGQGGEAGLTSGEMAALRFDEMERRLSELEDVQARLLELEERADFAERMLAERERHALPEPGPER